MSKPYNEVSILPQDKELPHKIQGKIHARRASVAGVIGGLGLVGGGIIGAFTFLKNPEQGPKINEPLSGMFVMGGVLLYAGVTSLISSTKELRTLRGQAHESSRIATEHYRDNEAAYQLRALQDAHEQGVAIKGWGLPEDFKK